MICDFLFSHRPADDSEFVEPTFEGTVEEGRATASRQTNQLGQTLVCREEVRPPTRKVSLQAVAEPWIERG